jgi:hypothetical protein
MPISLAVSFDLAITKRPLALFLGTNYGCLLSFRLHQTPDAIANSLWSLSRHKNRRAKESVSKPRSSPARPILIYRWKQKGNACTQIHANKKNNSTDRIFKLYDRNIPYLLQYIKFYDGRLREYIATELLTRKIKLIAYRVYLAPNKTDFNSFLIIQAAF